MKHTYVRMYIEEFILVDHTLELNIEDAWKNTVYIHSQQRISYSLLTSQSYEKLSL